jgi:hypothetical protein
MSTRVPTAGDHGRFDALTTTTGDALEVEDREPQSVLKTLMFSATLLILKPV